MKTLIKGFILILILFFCTATITSFTTKSKYFDLAESGLKKYNPSRRDYVIVVDYTKNIFSTRLFVLDMKNSSIVIESTVAHAWNSGVLYPSELSNQLGSNKSSGGCYITAGTKYGKFGYSMIIKGLDKGVNNNAQARAVIFHSTQKMSTPWSNGCFATPDKINKQIIDLTKNGCLVVCITK
jgi:hypothetical protein